MFKVIFFLIHLAEFWEQFKKNLTRRSGNIRLRSLYLQMKSCSEKWCLFLLEVLESHPICTALKGCRKLVLVCLKRAHAYLPILPPPPHISSTASDSS